MKSSKKELQILKYIELSIATLKRMPTRKELYFGADINNGSLARIIRRLEKKKKLIRTEQGIPYKLNGK
jgi:hypothetical protein